MAKTTLLKFKTLHGPVTLEGQEFVDEVNLEDASPELVRAAGSAHAAGVIDVSEGLDVSHVEDDETSLDILDEAMGDWQEPVRQEDGTLEPGRWLGPWAEGHYAQADRDEVGLGRMTVTPDIEPQPEVSA